MMRNKLLQNIFFGSELNKIDDGTVSTIEILKGADPAFGKLSDSEWTSLKSIVKGFFGKSIKGSFGGPITAGDAFFMAAYLAAFKPKSVIEIGVCSGVSSAFLLYAGDKLGLRKRGGTFLHSVDLLKFHGAEKNEVGRVVGMNYPSLAESWDLMVEVTAPELVENRQDLIKKIEASGPTLAFIDANHLHPWPSIDVLSVAKLLPKDSWIMLQDTQLMERWLANCVERGVPSPKPCRGPNLTTLLWPGSKVAGWDMCYNMGAVKLNVSEAQKLEFTTQILKYPAETGAGEMKICREHLERLTEVGKLDAA